MKLRFDPKPLLWVAILFVVLVLLATLGAKLGWARGFVGDVLAVIWVYHVLRTVCDAPVGALALAAFLVGLLIEFGQYLATLFDIQIANRALRILLGATPDWWDVLAYALGALIVVICSQQSSPKLSPVKR